MKRCFIVIAIIIFGSSVGADAQGSACTPQPECRIIKSPLIPGAPTTGMTPQKGRPGETKNLLDTNTKINRDTFRLPAATQ
jgi:hypothetical protein